MLCSGRKMRQCCWRCEAVAGAAAEADSQVRWKPGSLQPSGCSQQPNTVSVWALLKHTLLFTEDLPSCCSLCPSQPQLMSWLLIQREAPLLFVPGCSAAPSTDAPGTARWQTRGRGEKGAVALLPHRKKAWWERVCPGSAAARLWSQEG